MAELIRSASLTGFREVNRAAGVDPYGLLRAADLPVDCLDNPDLRIPAIAVGMLLESAARLPGLEHIGLRMARTRTVSNLGPMGLLLREQATLRQALEAMMRYSHLQNEALVLRMEETRGLVILREDLVTHQPMPLRQATELVVGVIFRLLRFFFGSAWHPSVVCFSHPAPADRTLYASLFDCSVQFGCEFSGIVCRASELDIPLPSADPVMARYARQYLERLDAGRAKRISEEVRNMFIVMLPSGRATFDNIARHLGVHRRTLLRHLTAENTSFADITNSVRRELAVRFLSEPDRPLTEITGLLGFGDLSVFSRWFRRIFGCSPAQYRRSRAGLGAQPVQ